MKISIIFTLLLFSILHATEKPSNYSAFYNYVLKALKPPSSVKENCEWQYAVVRVSTNTLNKITDYRVLNSVSDDFRNSFKFLKGYTFPKKFALNGRSLVFCISIENNKSDCLIRQKNYTPNEVLGQVFAYYNQQYQLDPSTVFIYEMHDISYSFD